ncbi:MAG: TraB/GumN family protein [Pseudoalteromonas sp.]|uniref:TraB/GumN family protein n=1 Tax=Pseudoalteromonas sp. TaxID=53249 RepID=UPI003F998596
MNILPRLTAYLTFTLLLTSFASNAEPALWQIEKEGVKSYLFGTVHVGDSTMKGLPKKITNAINASEKVIVEVDISTISPAEMQRRSMPFMMLRHGQKLQSQLSQQNYQKLTDYFKNKSIDIAMFDKFAPWAVMVTMMQIEFQEAGFSEQNGIDKQVITFAKDNNKPIGELETLEYQMKMFTNLSRLSNEMIEETFEQLADVETYFINLVNAWKTGDMDTLTDYYNDSFDDSNYGEISEKVMLIERNDNWVKSLTPRIGKEKLFIAVGALHLPEQHGLLKQFKDQGFKVTRL